MDLLLFPPLHVSTFATSKYVLLFYDATDQQPQPLALLKLSVDRLTDVTGFHQVTDLLLVHVDRSCCQPAVRESWHVTIPDQANMAGSSLSTILDIRDTFPIGSLLPVKSGN